MILTFDILTHMPYKVKTMKGIGKTLETKNSTIIVTTHHVANCEG